MIGMWDERINKNDIDRIKHSINIRRLATNVMSKIVFSENDLSAPFCRKGGNSTEHIATYARYFDGTIGGKYVKLVVRHLL
jgi:hypothetical protein